MGRFENRSPWDVLPPPQNVDSIEFSGDVNNFVSAHKYKVYAPTEKLLKLVVNSLVPNESRFAIGQLRLTECRLPLPGATPSDVQVCVSTRDFLGARTAMFGKTRLGKSNVVKIIAQSILETTKSTHNVGQLIFDINGEYANDNPQDNNISLASAYKDRCEIYALTKKTNTESKPLKINFYEHPDASIAVLSSLMREAGRDTSNYIKSFLSVDLPSVSTVQALHKPEVTRPKRKILMYWAILYRAGFMIKQKELEALLGDLDPAFSKESKKLVYGTDETKWPEVKTIDELAKQLEDFADANKQSTLPSSTKGKDLFDAEDTALLGFLKPKGGSGPTIIQPYRKYHDNAAGNFLTEIIAALNAGKTVILDLGNAPPEVMEYFSGHLSRAVFYEQVDKFSNDKLGNHYLQIYFEEAHNLFAPTDHDDKTAIYRRLAKEGAKYHIGMVYSTQSVSSVSKDLLGQTENFFIAHLASQDEVNSLAKINIAYESMKEDIMLTKTPGYIRMLTRSHRFVVPMQANKFEASIPTKFASAAKV